MSIGGHQSAAMLNDEWLTPPEILQALGPFDLDPCAPIKRPWPMAAEHYTVEDNGLAQPWVGRVWCNPPYGLETARWLNRMAQHGNGIALIFARTVRDIHDATGLARTVIWRAINQLETGPLETRIVRDYSQKTSQFAVAHA
jgi:hypothetical protein